MPSLQQALRNHDLGFLRIVSSLWGVELTHQSPDDAAGELAGLLLDPDLVIEVLTSLNPQGRAAAAALAAANGRIPWAPFTRQFGAIREMGIAKRDRDKPYLEPASAAEILWYRAFLFRAFLKTAKEPQEFAYIPDDLLELVQAWEHGAASMPDALTEIDHSQLSEPPGRGATPGEKKHILPASDRVLDDATTLLAALRLGHEIEPDVKLAALLQTAGLISEPGPAASKSAKANRSMELRADKVKAFLEAPRPAALEMLAQAWRSSQSFNELKLMPGLVFEGEWKNQPLVTRDFLMDIIEGIPPGAWWSLNAFIGGIKKSYPDFQRPAGDYDSWFIKRESDGTYLRGFAYWDQVDGALIRFFIREILYSLGLVELASADEGGAITAFHLLESVARGSDENGKIVVASNGRIAVPRLVPRAVRYQLARFCEWDEEKPDGYRYHVTPQSLTQAREQGLKVEHLLALLARNTDAGIPPALLKALKRWDQNGTEARAETQVILKVSRPEVLEELRNSKAARFLGEPLGPTSVIIKAGAQPKVMAALAELGLLAEDNTGQQ
ncbi:MAG: helicase-associated domain-containing protein [Anaerolineae bacterium]